MKTIEVRYDEEVGSTDKAIALKFDKELIWIPRSQVISWDPHNCTIEIPLWLTLTKGIEGYEV